MTMTRTSQRNLGIADSYDIWPVDDHRGDGGGRMIVVFREGFSSMLSDELGPMIWPTEEAAQGYIDAIASTLPRKRCDPGPRIEIED
jgi:hypothetical protein